jgi:hypothetical protein
VQAGDALEADEAERDPRAARGLLGREDELLRERGVLDVLEAHAGPVDHELERLRRVRCVRGGRAERERLDAHGLVELLRVRPVSAHTCKKQRGRADGDGEEQLLVGVGREICARRDALGGEEGLDAVRGGLVQAVELLRVELLEQRRLYAMRPQRADPRAYSARRTSDMAVKSKERGARAGHPALS